MGRAACILHAGALTTFPQVFGSCCVQLLDFLLQRSALSPYETVIGRENDLNRVKSRTVLVWRSVFLVNGVYVNLPVAALFC